MSVTGLWHFIRRNLAISAIVVVVIIAAGSFFILRRPAKQQTGMSFAELTANVVGFQPFQFNVLDGFYVNDSTLSYSQGILLFQLQNNQNQTIAVTEQLLPESLVDNTDPNATKVEGADGTAIITYNGTTTTGALFSNTTRGRQTMVLLNTTAALSQNTIEDLLRGLRPAS